MQLYQLTRLSNRSSERCKLSVDPSTCPRYYCFYNNNSNNNNNYYYYYYYYYYLPSLYRVLKIAYVKQTMFLRYIVFELSFSYNLWYFQSRLMPFCLIIIIIIIIIIINLGLSQQYFPTLRKQTWPRELSRYSDLLCSGWSGDRIKVAAKFLALFQTGPGVHPASYAKGNEFVPRAKSGRGVALTIHTLLAPRLK